MNIQESYYLTADSKCLICYKCGRYVSGNDAKTCSEGASCSTKQLIDAVREELNESLL